MGRWTAGVQLAALAFLVAACGGDDSSKPPPADTSPQVRLLAGHYGGIGHADGPAHVARFEMPVAVVVDDQGNRYVSDRLRHVIRRISPKGEVTTLAGMPGESGAVDGVGEQARFKQPTGLALDGQGSLYVADYGNSLIRKIRLADGEVSTVAGKPGILGNDSGGNGSPATLRRPIALAWHGDGLLVAEMGNQSIRRLVQQQLLVTVAGTGERGNAAPQIDALQARFSEPTGLAVDPSNGDVFVIDSGNCVIRRIRGTLVSVVAGVGDQCGSADGPAGVGRLAFQSVGFHAGGIAFDASGRLIISSSSGLRAMEPNGELHTLELRAPAGDPPGTPGLPQTQWLSGFSRDRDGLMLVADGARGVVRSIELSGASGAVVRTLAGQLHGSGTPVVAGKAGTFVWTVAAGRDGSLLLGGDGAYRLTPSGTVDRLPGFDGRSAWSLREASDGMLFAAVEAEVFTPEGHLGYFEGYRDGQRKFSIPVESDELGLPLSMAVDGQGRAVVADWQYGVISRVAQDGTITRIAGRKNKFGDTLGDALDVARFDNLLAVAVASNDDILVLENGLNRPSRLLRIAKVNGRDIVSLVSDDIGHARTLAVDAANNVYLWRAPECTILKIRANGERSVLAGHPGRCSFEAGAVPGVLTHSSVGGHDMVVAGDRLVMLMDENAVVEIGPLLP